MVGVERLAAALDRAHSARGSPGQLERRHGARELLARGRRGRPHRLLLLLSVRGRPRRRGCTDKRRISMQLEVLRHRSPLFPASVDRRESVLAEIVTVVEDPRARRPPPRHERRPGRSTHCLLQPSWRQGGGVRRRMIRRLGGGGWRGARRTWQYARSKTSPVVASLSIFGEWICRWLSEEPREQSVGPRKDFDNARRAAMGKTGVPNP